MDGWLRVNITAGTGCTTCDVMIKHPNGVIDTYSHSNLPLPFMTSLPAGVGYRVTSTCAGCGNCTAYKTGVTIAAGQTKIVNLAINKACPPSKPLGTAMALKVRGNPNCREALIWVHDPALPTEGAVGGPHYFRVHGPYARTKRGGDDYWVFPQWKHFREGKTYTVVACCEESPGCRCVGSMDVTVTTGAQAVILDLRRGVCAGRKPG